MKTKTKKSSSKIIFFKHGLKQTFLGILMCTGYWSQAQDIITFKDGSAVLTNLIELSDTQIKYRRSDNSTGPIYTIAKETVFSVQYRDGMKEVFGNEPYSISNNLPTEMSHPKQNSKSKENSKFEKDSSDFAKTKQKRFDGPRVGLTYVSPGTMADYLASEGKQPLVTQFGWQFESRLFTVDGNTQGIVEFIPMVAGIEQGLFIPSASCLIGVRGGSKRVFEFAMGPNFAITKDYKRETAGAMGVVIAFGTSFKSGNVNFPVNLAFIPSIGSVHNEWDQTAHKMAEPTQLMKYNTGWKLSLVIGFNSRKK